MLIQTPLRPDAVGANVLSSEALIAHLDDKRAASLDEMVRRLSL